MNQLITCPRCKGEKHLPEDIEIDDKMMIVRNCKICNGTGKVDWVQNMVQKEQNPCGYFYSILMEK